MRISAFNVGKIAKRRDATKVKPLVKEMLYSKFEGNTCTRWGLLQEKGNQYKIHRGKTLVSLQIHPHPYLE